MTSSRENKARKFYGANGSGRASGVKTRQRSQRTAAHKRAGLRSRRSRTLSLVLVWLCILAVAAWVAHSISASNQPHAAATAPSG